MTGQNTPVCLIRVIQYSYIHKSTKAQGALKAVWQVKSFVFITISDGFERVPCPYFDSVLQRLTPQVPPHPAAPPPHQQLALPLPPHPVTLLTSHLPHTTLQIQTN